MQLDTDTNSYAACGDSKLLRGSVQTSRRTQQRRAGCFLREQGGAALLKHLRTRGSDGFSTTEPSTPPGPALYALLRAFAPVRGVYTFGALGAPLRGLWLVSRGL